MQITLNLIYFLQSTDKDLTIFRRVFLSIALILVIGFMVLAINKIFYFIEMAYVEYVKKKLFYNHVYLFKKTLSKKQRSILRHRIKFYNKLSKKQKSYFEHRVYKTIHRTEFIGKDVEVNDEMKVLISGTLVKLTFGFRDYKIGSVQRVLIYPNEFYSTTNKTLHKGEFNLGYKALILSWKDVLHGYQIEDDNLNLAVHEFIHAIHFYYMSERKRSTSAAIFLDSFYELTNDLDDNSLLKKKLVSSKFLRDYAYTNQFEFLAVLIETFIETPRVFESQFPEMYLKVKGMLNFNFAGY